MQSIENASLEMAQKMEKSNILSILPPDQHVLKKRQLESEHLAANFLRIRDAVKLFAADIVYVNRDFSNKVTLMICTAIVEKFWAETSVRKEGENIAACRIQAIYHTWKAKKIYLEVGPTAGPTGVCVWRICCPASAYPMLSCVHMQVLKTYEMDEKRKELKAPTKNQSKQEKRSVMAQLLFDQRQKEEEQAKREVEAEILKERLTVDMKSCEPAGDGMDIVIAIDMSLTEFGDSELERPNIVTLTKVTKRAVYTNAVPHVTKELYVGSTENTSEILDHTTGTAILNRDLIPSREPPAPKPTRNYFSTEIEEIENYGEVSIVMVDARYPVTREEVSMTLCTPTWSSWATMSRSGAVLRRNRELCGSGRG